MPAALAGIAAFGGACIACKEKALGAGAPAGPAASSSAPAQTVSLRVGPTQVGARFKEVRKSALGLSVEFWQEDEKSGTSELSRNEEYARTTEVLGLVGGSPAKIRVHYERYRLNEARLGQPARQDAHLEGQTYILDAMEGSLTPSTADGKPVVGEERDSLAKLHVGLGAEDPVVTVIAKRPLQLGVAVRMTQDLAQRLSGNGGDLKDGTFTFVGTSDEAGQRVAQIEWSADMHTEEEGALEIDWHLKGHLNITTDSGRIRSSSVTGALDASGEKREAGKKTKMAGSGSVKDDYTWLPE